ncbi:peptidase M20 domain-containing protein 2-like [Centruroides sculpturatus]|uniref:peptidase M20 domain-containing protein 2-like n=1 Tax=Centruroides sculpturatus TaxID=218467 RepID=UPI000C6DD709|nr:peptidase M20 domain-containing protein 2-like [Centruroides sculpturatus]XP_023224732.1 peptidase M20 domain-containing protein 2-like [Centruroides sculpturatus]
MEGAKKLVDKIINEQRSRFNALSQEIWKNPETNYEEIHAHDVLVSTLQDFGFSVQKNYILPTAFRAEFGEGNYPKIAVLCEYDALPEIGHACGHNLIAEAGVAAAVAIKYVMENHKSIQGKIVVLGTPAEEGGGGKIKLLEAGAFKDIDIVLMVHPSPTDHLFPPFISLIKLKVNYFGKAAHASGYPWEGLNALDAAVTCYNNIALLRKQSKPNCIIHGIISNGGGSPSIIPDETELRYAIGANNSRELEDLKKRVEDCCLAAAQATGCEVKLSYDTEVRYEHLITNELLANTYKNYAEETGVKFKDGNPNYDPFVAPSDIGNVSHMVPSIQPLFSIGTTAPNHSYAFTEAAGSVEAQQPTLNAAKSMALTALEIFSESRLLLKVKEQFNKDIVFNS